jgi:hypothetical protein
MITSCVCVCIEYSPQCNSQFIARINIYIRFEVFTAMNMKNVVNWDVVPCRYFVNGRFGGTYLLHPQGVRNPRAMNQREQVHSQCPLTVSRQRILTQKLHFHWITHSNYHFTAAHRKVFFSQSGFQFHWTALNNSVSIPQLNATIHRSKPRI